MDRSRRERMENGKLILILFYDNIKGGGVINDPHGLPRRQEMSPQSEGRALPHQMSPGENMPRPRSPSCEAER